MQESQSTSESHAGHLWRGRMCRRGFFRKIREMKKIFQRLREICFNQAEIALKMALCLLVCDIFITLFSWETNFKSVEKVLNRLEIDWYWTCYTNTDCSISGPVLLRGLSSAFGGTPWSSLGSWIAVDHYWQMSPSSKGNVINNFMYLVTEGDKG